MFLLIEQKANHWNTEWVHTQNDHWGFVLTIHSHWYHIKSEASTYIRTNWALEVADILLDNGAHHFLHTFWVYKGGLTPSKFTSAYFTSMLKEVMKNSSKTTASAKTFSIYIKKDLHLLEWYNYTKHNEWEFDNFPRGLYVQSLRTDREMFGTFWCYRELIIKLYTSHLPT